jgi:glycosyltransferase involved in cell wall biosynthesis
MLRIPFLTGLGKRGFSITAAGTGDQAPFSKAGIPYRRYQFDRFDAHSPHRSEMRSIIKLVQDVQPDIIQTFDTKPNLLVPFAIRRDVPIVRTINGLGWVFSSASLRALALRPIYCVLQRLASQCTSATVFQNRDDKAFFEKYRLLGRGPACLISGSGIDIGAAQPLDAAHKDPRGDLSIGDSGVVITVSRLTRQKGILSLLEAADIVHAEYPQARFVLVGPRESEGPFAIPQDEISRRAPYVIALGKRDDVPALLQKADIFAFPSEYREGIPRVLLEAGLAGLPIVTTRMPGCSDVVTDGWNGYLVPRRDPQRLARRIMELLRDPAAAKAMGRRSAPLIRHELSLAVVLDRYERLYKRVLDGKWFEAAPVGESGATDLLHATVQIGKS